MPKRSLKRHLPTVQSLRENRALRPFEKWLNRPELWHFHRRSVSGAFFVGLFAAFLPVPSQMVAAAIFAVCARVNLPIATGLVWITNPVTIPPMFFFCYRLGAWLLGAEVKINAIRLEWSWLVDTYNNVALTEVLFPLLFGCLVVGWTAGVTGFVIVRLAWRAQVIKRWQLRRQRLREKRTASVVNGLRIS